VKIIINQQLETMYPQGTFHHQRASMNSASRMFCNGR